VKSNGPTNLFTAPTCSKNLWLRPSITSSRNVLAMPWMPGCRVPVGRDSTPLSSLPVPYANTKDGILAYIKGRATNARVEGINNRLRMVARKGSGFHSAEALISMLFLCCGGIQLNPPFRPPQKL
jgi:hypothetical protein